MDWNPALPIFAIFMTVRKLIKLSELYLQNEDSDSSQGCCSLNSLKQDLAHTGHYREK